MWFYQEVDEVEQTPDFNRPGPSRGTSSRTPVAGSSASNMRNKRLFLTDGWTCPFAGVCIYMFRINISKQLPEEGFHKDLWVWKSLKIILITSPATTDAVDDDDELVNTSHVWILVFLICNLHIDYVDTISSLSLICHLMQKIKSPLHVHQQRMKLLVKISLVVMWAHADDNHW